MYSKLEANQISSVHTTAEQASSDEPHMHLALEYSYEVLELSSIIDKLNNNINYYLDNYTILSLFKGGQTFNEGIIINIIMCDFVHNVI